MVLITIAVLLLMIILLIGFIPRSKLFDTSDTTTMKSTIISTEIVNSESGLYFYKLFFIFVDDKNDQSTKPEFTSNIYQIAL